ncbi:uncharacterized protein LOC100264883 isoform X2 [Vitis vinifera]|uniref:uncharacterized protein LOC100264883 isoform X2 n=1 Tax=Vitis vinifera TaxID=29760 RepID=UPI0008FEC7F1|nr:uncharacterized protein LOC100264883 isoform X2 [Vitis vinifera]|eukprot:XP_019081781.1 PREDICTED: uncharacterized protein LOC100264883 isoform X2 [Vitis vinifera]
MLLAAPDCFSLRSSFLPRSFRFRNSRGLSLNSHRTWTSRPRASLITTPDSFQVGRLIGSYGFMNITSYSGFQPGLDVEYSSEDMGRLRVQDVGEGNVKIRLYEGIITQGPLRGTPVIFKVYPGQRAAGIEADMMAANELNAHAFLQSNAKDISQNLQMLLGGFETKTGEQWLAFRNDGKYSAADYAKVSSEKLSKKNALGEQKSWNPFDQELTIKRKREFVIKLLRGAISGLAYMHDHNRLHQSLGPSSVVLKFSNMENGPGTLADGLWRRASAAGAFTPMEKRAFGISDDIYEAGLLFAYLAFVPFCEAGIMDSLSLQRLLESTFRLDLKAMREYCLADDSLLEAVRFLDLGDGAGWELLQAMLNPDFRKRPIAEAVLNHRFMTGAVL